VTYPDWKGTAQLDERRTVLWEGPEINSAAESRPYPVSVSIAWTMRRNDLLFLLAVLRSMRAENFG